MADNTRDWRALPPVPLQVHIVSRPCGWHVYLRTRSLRSGDRVREQTLAKDCIPYKAGDAPETALTEVQAMTLACWAFQEGIASECDNL